MECRRTKEVEPQNENIGNGLVNAFDDSEAVTYYAFCFGFAGTPGGIRTHDPWFRRPVLYPLSYRRTIEEC